MSEENNYDMQDVSEIQVPESLIHQILENTTPLEEAKEEVLTQPKQGPISEDTEVVKLLSLMFEEFDKLNKRFDVLEESINEMTTAGSLGTYQKFGMGSKEDRKLSKHPERDAQAELDGSRRSHKESRSALADLLAKRIGR
jgi:hypothetical protein